MSPFMPEQFAAVQKSSLNQLFALTNMAFDGFQKLTELNLQAVRTTHSDNRARERNDMKDTPGEGIQASGLQ